jgi:FtsZ-binding cell division protein ZapB
VTPGVRRKREAEDMNPLAPIEKWINEHGSASILRDHVALLKEKMAALEEKASVLEKKNSELERQNAELETENRKLKQIIAKYQRTRQGPRITHIPI